MRRGSKQRFSHHSPRITARHLSCRRSAGTAPRIDRERGKARPFALIAPFFSALFRFFAGPGIPEARPNLVRFSQRCVLPSLLALGLGGCLPVARTEDEFRDQVTEVHLSDGTRCVIYREKTGYAGMGGIDCDWGSEETP